MPKSGPRFGSHNFPGLWVRWKRRVGRKVVSDIVLHYDRSEADAHLLRLHLTPLIAELQSRGFDVKTFRMSIARAKDRSGA